MKDSHLPKYDLVTFRITCSSIASLNMTLSAMKDAAALGFDGAGVVAVIQTMRPEHFYKSMASEGIASEWQDVYHVPSDVGTLYIKFKAAAVVDFKLLSFKLR